MLYVALNQEDAKIMQRIVNQGIDSRLEGFTKSEFLFDRDAIGAFHLRCHIHQNELSILLRRLLEYDDERAEDLADDIVSIEYEREALP